jgi:hypothetical protein
LWEIQHVSKSLVSRIGRPLIDDYSPEFNFGSGPLPPHLTSFDLSLSCGRRSTEFSNAKKC